ncbi:MAG: cation:proton antiporter [Myxococcales bacterium]|nr:cation:proton antiporter [Myxococcales bacterium]
MHHHQGIPILLILGIFFLLGWGAHNIGKRVHIPRVTLLLLVGLLGGPAVFDIVPKEIISWFPTVAQMALSMIGFLLGESLVGKELRESAKPVLYISVGATVGTVVVVTLLIWLVSQDLVLALVLAGVATATDPAATADVAHENKADGPLTHTLLGVVAVDDIWGVMIFSLILVAANTLAGNGSTSAALIWGARDVMGGLLLGAVLGLPMAWFVGRARPDEPTLLEASGFVLFCAGFAHLIGVSYLLACMSMGCVVAMRNREKTRPFREIEGASEPFLIIFFLLAGHNFMPSALKSLGVIGVVYIVSRTLGRVVGAHFTARAANSPEHVQRYIGWCLLPQAGVALGLALMVSEHIPKLRPTILPLVITTTIFFELFGPFLTRWMLEKADETNKKAPPPPTHP